MKNDVGILINNLLNETGKVNVPGLGGFWISRSPAKMSVDKLKVYPPQERICFESNSSTSDTLLQSYICRSLNIGTDSANTLIDNFVKEVLENLTSDGEAVIPHVGRLSEEGNKVIVKEGFDSIGYRNALPTLKLRPVPTFTSEEYSAPSKTIKKTSRIDWLIPLLMGLLLAMGILLYKGCQSVEQWKSNKKNTEILRSSVDSSDSEHKIDTTTPTTRKPSVNSYNQEIPKSGQCVIITASLERKKNIKRMENRLKEFGYEVYKSMHNGYTRIGIKYDCREQELDEFLYTVRNEIAAQAWYLDPNKTVPYN